MSNDTPPTPPSPETPPDPPLSQHPPSERPPTDQAAPGPPSASRRRRRLVLGLVAALMVTALALACGFGVPALLDYRADRRAERDLAAALAAYRTGDCARVLDRVSAVPRSHIPASRRKSVELQQDSCEALQHARAGVPEVGDQVVAYANFLAVHESDATELTLIARREVRSIITSSTPGGLASRSFCFRIDDLSGRDILKRVTPELLWQCALRTREMGVVVATQFYIRLREDFAETPEAEKATARLAKDMVAAAIAGGEKVNPLDPPAGRGRAPGGQAVVVVINAANAELEFAISGEISVVDTIRPCRACKRVRRGDPGRCIPRTPHLSVALPPGKYKVALRYTDGSEWVLARWNPQANSFYEACYVREPD